MKQVISLALAGALLAGCATPYTPQMQAADANSCVTVGWKPGQPAYDDCLKYLKSIRDAEQKKKNDQVAAAVLVGALIVGGAAVAANNPDYFGGGNAPTYKGNCRYSWQYDSAGRRCGNRAASVRPGGY